MEEMNLQQILDARERRACRQRELLAAYGAPLVVLTVNAPGPVKRFDAADRVFDCARQAADRIFSGMELLHTETLDLPTGLECYWSPRAETGAVKRQCCALEETLPYGRLIDLDVLDESGAPVSRIAYGFAQRGCMVCGRPGAYCASRRLHPLPEILAAFVRIAETAETDGEERRTEDA